MAQQGDRIGPIRTESDGEDWLEAYVSRTPEERWWEMQEGRASRFEEADDY